MADYTSKQIDEMEGAFGGGLKKARAELGVASFGMQVVNLPPNYTDYPEHDHEGDGQEEVYSVMRGSGEIDVEGERIPLEPRRARTCGSRHQAQDLLRPRGPATARAGRNPRYGL